MRSVTRTRVSTPALALALASVVACRGEDVAPAAEREPAAPAQVPQPRDDSPMEQLKGVWVMDLAQVPETALTPEFRAMKARGDASRVQIEYTITDTELFLVKDGEGGRLERHWYYEIVRQVDNRLELEQEDPTGKKEKLAVTVRPDLLILGTGRGQVPLRRKR
jgi:hypothetical protein